MVLPDGECEGLITALVRNEAGRSRAGIRHLMADATVARLAIDQRLLGIARGALGETATPFRATLFEKSGRSNWLVVWHQDTALPLASYVDSPTWGPWSMKNGIRYAHAPDWALARIVALRIHLDASYNDNGPLRVIPGSHRAGVLTDEEVFRMAQQKPNVECLVGRGGVMAMRPLLIHSSSKAQSSKPRRVLHIEYADALRLNANVCLAIA